ncbi:unnamed protein product [Ostreobium quekettii]|uniref:2Fe-2S ferredoxin-type domain-containing protein n=1 Tax=Ostreobium quekettii TaxID=121088 RepID=A0A8S1IL81_9CHLO|nr:unnamed protein product [Ostreobium quekettii]|eukprot:evm.model.scf_929.1 EVM.evm.TU.scf_929.1   scf_929:1585-3621(+)
MASLLAPPLGASTAGRRPGQGGIQYRAPSAVAYGRPGRAVRAHKVEIEHEGRFHVIEVEEGATILETALDMGVELPHDCKMGVCMTCPAKLVEGEVDQSGAMMSEDVAEKGFALLCVAQPQTDCKIKTCSEDEYLDEQLVTSKQ